MIKFILDMFISIVDKNKFYIINTSIFIHKNACFHKCNMKLHVF